MDLYDLLETVGDAGLGVGYAVPGVAAVDPSRFGASMVTAPRLATAAGRAKKPHAASRSIPRGLDSMLDAALSPQPGRAMPSGLGPFYTAPADSGRGLPVGTMANVKSGVTAGQAVKSIRDAVNAMNRNQARRQLEMDAAKARTMYPSLPVGAGQGFMEYRDEGRGLGDQVYADINARLKRARGGAAPGQQIDPRWLLGGISVSGQGLTRGGGGATPAPASMGRDALAARLAQMSGAGAKYQDGNVLPGTRTRVEVRPDGRIALIGRAAMDPERAMPEEGLPTVRDRLMAARARRAAENAPRMLTSRNPAVREKGQALLNTMRGVASEQGEGVDVAAAMAEANRIARMYGNEAGRAAFEAKMRQAQDDMERKSKTADLEKTLTSQEKIAGMRADSDVKLATNPAVVFAQALAGGMTPEQAMERARLMQQFGAGAGAGTVLAPRPQDAPASIDSILRANTDPAAAAKALRDAGVTKRDIEDALNTKYYRGGPLSADHSFMNPSPLNFLTRVGTSGFMDYFTGGGNLERTEASVKRRYKDRNALIEAWKGM